MAATVARKADRSNIERPAKKLRFSDPESVSVSESQPHVDPARVTSNAAGETASVSSSSRKKSDKKRRMDESKPENGKPLKVVSPTAPQQTPTEEDSTATPADAAQADLTSIADDAAAIAERKARKRAIRASRRSQAPADTASPAYLTYLKTFHEDKTNWKFNKTQQINLFKHLLSTKDIPSSYNPAIHSYLRGLQSSGAAERPFEQAAKILNTTPSPSGETYYMETPKDRQRILERAAARDQEIAENKFTRLDRNEKASAYGVAADADEGQASFERDKDETWERASIVWASLYDLMNQVTAKRAAVAKPKDVDITKLPVKTVLFNPAVSSSSNKRNADGDNEHGPKKKKVRGRKQRTRDEDVEISSSESDSDGSD